MTGKERAELRRQHEMSPTLYTANFIGFVDQVDALEAENDRLREALNGPSNSSGWRPAPAPRSKRRGRGGMASGRGGMGSKKHGVSGHAGKSPKMRMHLKLEAKKAGKAARKSDMKASIQDLMHGKKGD